MERMAPVRTVDICLATYIVSVTNIRPTLIGNPEMKGMEFEFPPQPDVQAAVVSYNSGGKVVAQRFGDELRRLRRDIRERRREVDG